MILLQGCIVFKWKDIPRNVSKFYPKMKKRFACILAFWGLTVGVAAQPSYLLSKKNETRMGLSIASMALGNLYIGNQLNGYTEAALLALTTPAVPAYDRWALQRWDEDAAHRSDYLFYSAAAWSAASVCLPALRDGSFKSSVPAAAMWIEMNALTWVFTDLTKNLVTRNRPFVYNINAPLEMRIEADARKSFFSGHTSMTAANSFYAAKVFTDLYPNSKWKPWVWSAAVVLPAITAQQRMAAGKHFFSDVLIGYGVGALIGWGIPQLHLVK
jgi:hypothetical protein